MADDAGPGRHRPVNVFLALKLLRRVAPETKPAGGLSKELIAVRTSVRIVATRAVAFGNRLVDDRPVCLNVTESAELPQGNRQGKRVPFGLARLVAGLACPLGHGTMKHLAGQDLAVAPGGDARLDWPGRSSDGRLHGWRDLRRQQQGGCGRKNRHVQTYKDGVALPFLRIPLRR